ncbi:MAG: Zn-dependent M16 (insulinase) family peptidase [Pseudohongiellaceae bacterium]|jgi:Zn-dependent M16 (insulinase) family peptidase
MSESAVTSSTNASQTTKPSQVHPAFQWLRSESIPSLNIVMEEYQHKVTGAMHYHLASENTENVFIVAFRTVPMDSTGVAHILEHTALCGSKRYPVRDPFFMMIRRSLNTFMNAFTSSDWTAYPFASKNKKDFNNLLDVYLDAAFFSRLHELDFAQEGHRLEFTEMENPDSELQYKGVVFNEMKGAMSSTNSVLWHTLSKHLFPTSTYHYNSGGEPEDIPKLAYEDLVSFYKSHYHPSNSVFMTFGDIPAVEHHHYFEDLALKQFSKLDVHIAVTDEKRYSAPIKVEETYAAEQSETNKHHVVIGWLLGHSTDLEELFKAQLLSSVLLDNSASPLLKVLETTDLGSAPSPMCGLEDSNREMSFMAGLEGCAEGSTEAVESLVLSTLEEIANNGVDPEQVEAALHQLELNQREISGDSYPYGLQLILTGLSTAMHRGDPINLLNIDPVLEKLREQVLRPEFIPNLIRSLILNNQHRLTLTLSPDTELANKKVEAEIAKLKAIKQSLSSVEASVIVEKSLALAARQEVVDNPEILPKVDLSDVPKTISEPQRSEALLPNGSKLSSYAQGTNGLSYQQVVIQLPALEEHLVNTLPLYTTCVTELGVGAKDYSQVQTWAAQVSGGVNCFSSIRGSIDDINKVKGLLTYSSKCLSANHKQMTELLKQSMTDVRFDETQRLAELIEQIAARKESSITGQGHSLAMTLASSGMSPTAKLSHHAGGLAGIQHLKKLRDTMSDESSRQSLLGDFAKLHDAVLSAPREFMLIAEDASLPAMKSHIEAAWAGSEKTKQSSKLSLPFARHIVRQVWTTSTQVSFCAKAYPTVPSSHEDNAVLSVLAGFLRNGFLHKTIREQGGAYGGGASQDTNSASFRFFSYRDPRLEETLDDFDKSLDWVVSGNHGDHQLEEAILGVIASLDKPSSPAGEAKQAYYNHLFSRDLDLRKRFRQRALDTTMEDLRNAVATYFDPNAASIGVISNPESADRLASMGIERIDL